LAGVFIAGPIWRMNLLTLPDLFRNRFGPRSELAASIIMVPSYFGWIAVQFVALAQMLELFFELPVTAGILIVAAVGTGYTLMGGMWSVTLTDAVQIILVIVGLVILAATVLLQLGQGDAVGGFDRLLTEPSARLRAVVPTETLKEFLGWLGLFAAGSLGNLPAQDLLQRVFAAKSDVTARRACLVAGGAYLALGLIPVGLGLAASILVDAEQSILPALASSFLSPPVAVVFTVALLSAVLSTIDSAILSPAAVLAQNVFSRFSRAEPLHLNRIAVLLVATASVAVAFLGEDAYTLLESAYEIGLVGLFVPMAFGLYTRPASGHAAMASMVSGTLVWAAHVVLGWEAFGSGIEALAQLHLPVGLCSTAVSFITYVAVEYGWSRR
jgi:Na+/proline symporter